MSWYRTTTAPILWFMLLVVFSLYVAGADAFQSSQSGTSSGKPAVKRIVLMPGNNDCPANDIQCPGNHPGKPARSSIACIDTRLARFDADTGTVIRGPPAGQRYPA